MFDERFRRFIAPGLGRPARALRAIGVTPNQVSVAGFLVAVGAAGAIASGRPVVGISLWLGSRLLDALDGAVAREGQVGSAFGGYLDVVLDMAAYSLMAVAYAAGQPEQRMLWLLVLTGYVLAITTTAVLSSLLERRQVAVPGNNRSVQFTPGFAEAGETSIVYVALALRPDWARWILVVWLVLLAATAVQRTLTARALLRD
ncbi:MAG: CDP-alcohol phosphatidyltransferase family protein [Gemmatimonadales bacterium]|nr:CDP-alcohol phosphatidyltransferase family protein [Gemmatimonadales bacterium]